jgi:hypothetical protein
MGIEQQPKPALPLLALLALASALGVAVAVALAAVAMLLAAPAYADEPVSGIYLFRLPQKAVLERLTFTQGIGAPEPALLTLRHGASIVERTAPIGAGKMLRVELEYRARGLRRRVLASRC